jgi:hypothetical protein
MPCLSGWSDGVSRDPVFKATGRSVLAGVGDRKGFH